MLYIAIGDDGVNGVLVRYLGDVEKDMQKVTLMMINLKQDL